MCILVIVRGWILLGVTIGKIFVLVYFMFHGVWISLRVIYFFVNINNFGGMVLNYQNLDNWFRGAANNAYFT